MKLIERYALSSGLKIGKQYLLESFYPLPFEKYITIHGSSGMLGKNYPYYTLVLELIKPYLDKEKINIVQLGSKDDAALPNCHHTQGKTNMHQASYLIHNSMLHLGNDSIWGHRAGYLGVPLVQPWGPTDPKNHSAYNFDPSKTIFLESHRWGRNPTFASQESPSSISLIPPESIAEAVLRLLGINHIPFDKTQFIGQFYQHTIFDYIPNVPFSINLPVEVPITVRMDIDFNEQNLISLLQTGRKVTIVTSKPINLNVLYSFKQNILSYNHEINEDCPVDYPKKVKTIIQNSVFFSREKSDGILSNLRFKYFDYCSIEQVTWPEKKDLLREIGLYLNKPVDKLPQIDTMYFKTNKFIVSNSKVYLSYAHVSRDISITDLNNRSAQIIDDELFMRDFNHYLIYANSEPVAS